ncbi:MAG: hypothetical protein FJX75_23150 [Armatimonadetes bacterium]|nr:hypothetical protein [Armatimonadota bacterium]
MGARVGVVLIGMALAIAQAGAQEQVRVEVSPLGAVRFRFPDGVTADWFQAAMGAEWAYANWWDGLMVEGNGQDLFTVGQRTQLPVRNADDKVLDLFAQFAKVEGAPEVLHFTYRFSAPEATRLNTAYIECQLPAEQFVGAALQAIDGPACAPVLPAEAVEAQSHLTDGMGSGLAAADGTSHGIWVQLDQPKWCIAVDVRVWKQPWFALQFCALAAANGTTLAKDATAEISGNLVFACPVKLPEPETRTPASSLVGETLQWSAADGAGLSLQNAKGERVAWFHPLFGGGDAKPARLKEEVREGPEGRRIRLEAEWVGRREAKLSLKQTALVKDGALEIEAELVGDEAYDGTPIMRFLTLPRKHFDGCTATFVSEGAPSVALASDPLGGNVIGRAMARGLRIAQGDTPLIELEADAARCWMIYAFEESFGVAECLLGNPLARHGYGTSGNPCASKLTCRAGRQGDR